MKIVDVNGNEVEISDEQPLAKTARKLSELGYSTIDEFESSYADRLKKLEEQRAADDAMIKRQSNELGMLRKQVGTAQPKDDEGIQTDMETHEQREDRLGKRITAFQENLTDEERSYADEQFKQEWKNATPEQRALLKTNEGRAAFLELVFDNKSVESTEISLFGQQKPKPKSITDQVKELFGKQEEKTTARPRPGASVGIPSQVVKQEVTKAKNTATSAAVNRSGDLLSMLGQLDR